MNNRKRTADYSSPPVGALVGTFNNPGVRYFVRKIHDDGSVDVTERPAIPPPHWSLWENKTFTREEWARLMDRWVLVWIATVTNRPVQVSLPFETITTQHMIDRIKGMMAEHFSPCPFRYLETS